MSICNAGGYSVKQHLLGSYLDALGSIIVAQVFKSKAIDGGLSGAKRLAKMPDICRLLNSNGEPSFRHISINKHLLNA